MKKKSLLERVYIGLEWEPQFTLLSHAEHQVFFEYEFTMNGEKEPFVIVKKSGKKRVPERPLLTGNSKNNDNPDHVTVAVNDVKFKTFMKTVAKAVSKQLSLSTKTLPKKFFTEKLMNLVGVDGSNIEFRTIPSSIQQLPNSILISDSLLRLFMEKLVECVPGGIGVFLPKTNRFDSTAHALNTDGEVVVAHTSWEYSPTKHVNLSFPDLPIYDRYYTCKFLTTAENFRTKVQFKTRQANKPKRMHITVPYNFTDYEALVRVAYPLYEAVHKCPELPPSGNTVMDISEQNTQIAKFLDNWTKNNQMTAPMLLKYVKQTKVVNLKGLL